MIGFLVILALVVVSVLLFRSMIKHIRKVPRSFDAQSFEAQSFDEPTAPAEDTSRPTPP